MSWSTKPISVTRAAGSSLNTPQLPTTNPWNNNGQWGAKQPGSGAGKPPGPPQMPTVAPPVKPVGQAPAPKDQGAKPPPAGQQVGSPSGIGGMLNNGGLSGLMGSIKEKLTAASGAANPGYDQISKMTQAVPPLSKFTPQLGSFQEPADAALRFIQNGVRGDPARFAAMAGGLAPGLTGGLLSAGPVGMAALPGLYGLMGGGESFAAAHQFLKPLLPRLGLG